MSYQRTRVMPVLISVETDGVLMADGSGLPVASLFSYAKAYKDGFLGAHFEFDRLVQRRKSDWSYYLEQAEQSAPAVWIISCYVWNIRESLALAQQIKVLSPNSLILAGGPHIPAYEADNRAFLFEHPYVDVTARGEGEITFSEVLESVAAAGGDLRADLSAVNGISFRRDANIIKTAERAKSRDLSAFPSPYLTGELDDPSFDELDILVLETNRGCPFGCTFCDWGAATLQKFALFDMERVKAEIEVIARKRPNSIYVADSNFGAFERDIEIARLIAEAKDKYGYPKKFGSSFAKNASPRLAEIIRILHKGGLQNVGLISMQSTDSDTLNAIQRANIRNEKYELLIDIFKREGMLLSSELLIGLPGQTLKSQKQDLQFFIDRKLMTIAYNVQVMPNAPMNEPSYRQQYAIETDLNGFVMSASTFTYEDQQFMIKRFLAFQLFYVVGVLRYILYFFQLEHGIKAMDFITHLLECMNEEGAAYPLLDRVNRELLVMKHEWSPCLVWETEESEFLFNHLDDFFEEITRFASDKFGIQLESDVASSLFIAQSAVMPVLGKSVPFSVGFSHDIVAWFEQVKAMRVVDHCPVGFSALSSFPPGKMTVRTLKKRVIRSLSLGGFNRFTGEGWELNSPLRLH